MIDKLADQVASVLERRFLKNAFLPVLLFFPAVLAPALTQTQWGDALVAAWRLLPGSLRALEIVGYFTFVWFLSAIVASQWRNIIRLYEGYPLNRLPFLWARGVNWHRSQLRELSNPRVQNTWYLRYWAYPGGRDVLPTRLGNVIRAAETYPLHRYNAETILIWPRLYHVLPQPFVDDVEDARATLEFLLVISLWMTSFACISPCVTLLVSAPATLALLCFIVGMVGAYAMYLSGVAAAAEYGEQLRAAFELYRLELFARLQIEEPTDLARERLLWAELTDFIGKGVRPDWSYMSGESPLSLEEGDLQSRSGPKRA